MQLKTYSVMLIIFVYVFLIGGSIHAQTILKPDEGVRKISWSPDGQKIATANPDGLVRIWGSGGQLITSFIAHENGTRAVVWSPDGTRLATGGADDVVKIWDNSGELIFEFEVYSEGILDLLWHPNGIHLYTLGFNIVSVWDATTGNLIQDFFMGTASNMTINSSGEKIAFIVLPNSTVILNAISLDPEFAFSSRESSLFLTNGVAWIPDSNLVASADYGGEIRFWDVQNQTSAGVIWNVGYLIEDMEYSPNGTLLAVALDDGSDGGIVQILDADTGTIVKTYTANGVVLDLEWSPNSDRIAFVGVENDPDPSNDITIYASPISDLTYNPLSAEG